MKKSKRRDAHDSKFESLRDPTVHELHNGPEREKLPEEIRNSSRSETVCKFCGVSYLVFSEIKELEKRLAATEDQLLEHQRKAAQFNSLQQKVHDLVAAQQTQNEAYSQLKKHSANLEACVYDREQAIQRSQKEKCIMESKISGVKAVLSREKAAIKRLRENTSRTLNDMASLMRSTQHEVAVVNARLRREEETRLIAERELATTQQMLEMERETNTKQDKQVSGLRSAINDLEEEWKKDVSRLEKLLEAEKSEASTRDDTHQKQVEQLEAELAATKSELEKAIRDATVERDETQMKLLDAQNRCKEVQSLAQNLTSQVEEKNKKIKHLYEKYENDMNKCRAEILQKEETIRQLKLSADSFSGDMQAKLKKVESDMATERGQNRMEINKLQRQVSELIEKNDIYKKKISTATDALSESEKNGSALKKQFDELAQKVRRMESTAGDADKEREAELAAAKAHYNAELAELREKLKCIPVLEKKLDSVNNDLAVESSKAVRFQRAAEAAESVLQTTKTDLSKLLNERSEECGRLKSRLAALEGRLAHAESENKSLRAQLETAPSSDEVASAQKKLSEANNKIAELESDLADKNTKIVDKDVSTACDRHFVKLIFLCVSFISQPRCVHSQTLFSSLILLPNSHTQPKHFKTSPNKDEN